MKQLFTFALLISNMAFSTEQAPTEDKPQYLVQHGLRCTTEYNPAVCTYLDISVEGSNRCFARIELQAYAAAHQITIDPSKVVCVAGI